MPKLTKAYIDKIEPPATGYEIHWDGGHDSAVKGFGLRCSAPSKHHPKGKRVFVATGRVRGRQVNLTLGPLGELTEAEARDKARRVLQRMREGVDPRDERKHQEAMEVTLRDVADSYMARPGKLKASSAAQIERRVTTTLAQWQHILGTPAGVRELHTTPIHRYDEALAFAQKYAPFMAHPITILPITAKDYVERNQESLTRLWEQLPPDVRATAAAAYEGRFQ